MTWPHALYTIVAAAVLVLAVATAWKYGGRVLPQNRVWTRALLLLYSALVIGPRGWLLPLGAVYVLARYGKVWRHHRPTTATP